MAHGMDERSVASFPFNVSGSAKKKIRKFKKNQKMEKKKEDSLRKKRRKKFIFGDIVDLAVVMKLTTTVVICLVFGVVFLHSRMIWQQYRINHFHQTGFKNLYPYDDAFTFNVFPQRDFVLEFYEKELIVNTSMYLW